MSLQIASLCIHKNLIFQFKIRQREEQRTENKKQILSFLVMTFSDDMHNGEGERSGWRKLHPFNSKYFAYKSN